MESWETNTGWCIGWYYERVGGKWQEVSRYKGIDRFIYELRGETIMSELNIQFVIADGTIQIKDQVSK